MYGALIKMKKRENTWNFLVKTTLHFYSGLEGNANRHSSAQGNASQGRKLLWQKTR